MIVSFPFFYLQWEMKYGKLVKRITGNIIRWLCL